MNTAATVVMVIPQYVSGFSGTAGSVTTVPPGQPEAGIGGTRYASGSAAGWAMATTGASVAVPPYALAPKTPIDAAVRFPAPVNDPLSTMPQFGALIPAFNTRPGPPTCRA